MPAALASSAGVQFRFDSAFLINANLESPQTLGTQLQHHPLKDLKLDKFLQSPHWHFFYADEQSRVDQMTTPNKLFAHFLTTFQGVIDWAAAENTPCEFDIQGVGTIEIAGSPTPGTEDTRLVVFKSWTKAKQQHQKRQKSTMAQMEHRRSHQESHQEYDYSQHNDGVDPPEPRPRSRSPSPTRHLLPTMSVESLAPRMQTAHFPKILNSSSRTLCSPISEDLTHTSISASIGSNYSPNALLVQPDGTWNKTLSRTLSKDVLVSSQVEEKIDWQKEWKAI